MIILIYMIRYKRLCLYSNPYTVETKWGKEEFMIKPNDNKNRKTNQIIIKSMEYANKDNDEISKKRKETDEKKC